MATRKSIRSRKAIDYAGLDIEVDTTEFASSSSRPVKRRKTTKTATDAEYEGAASDSDAEVTGTTAAEGIVIPHSRSLHDSDRIKPCLASLLDWYTTVKHTRGMPWRHEYDATLDDAAKSQRAYEVLVSEIMLQQTQVATVVPYYTAWLKRFPTIRDLAAVEDIEEVNALWKGLGYYRRASLLLKGAKKVVDDFEGRIPSDVKVLERDVSAVGRYTAGAVCSIAYGVKAPAVDGNVLRLFSRLLAVHAPLKSKSVQDIIWDAASVLVSQTDRPGDLNQAFIELGSTVCKPTSPLCDTCPIQKGCGAYLLSTSPSEDSIKDLEDACSVCEPFPSAGSSVTRFPMKVTKKKARVEASVVTVVRLGPPGPERMVLMSQRPAKGLLAGLWEFPTTDLKEEATLPVQLEATRSVVVGLDPNLDDEGYTPVVLGSFLHLFSHIRKTYHVVCVDVQSAEGMELGKNSKWVKVAEFESMNVGKGSEKVWEMILRRK
ncbi:hypothetical protein FRB94_011875 [Tulasnella sp. JGI-2019a]|nr:hypothetical protein FRB94_011875 [Tulasnella sp. JGI-2019a]KAG9014437.1 hypothetical protein FRB93_013562 [Tulasnella sp. JGI-2019a]KAG9039697.1 hypothetical protein FRB95_007124 [Tulasnella sp. JGI-2019a]